MAIKAITASLLLQIGKWNDKVKQFFQIVSIIVERTHFPLPGLFGSLSN